jgi:hypothetical protein
MEATSGRAYTNMDKSEWDRGPWDDEPDKIQWVDRETGLDCLIVRNRLGALCGYVGLPPEHPCHGADYDAVRRPEDDEDGYDYIDVHGGLTYADSCQEDAEESKGICHVPLPGRPADVWWLGFDCAHSMDVVPGMDATTRSMGRAPLRFGGEQYRTIDYVRSECARLAEQLTTAVLRDA